MGVLLSSNTVSATGPLRVSSANPRYFEDCNGKIVYLTGAHTWSNFKDMGDTDPPEPFDYKLYLDFLSHYNHNFIRLWTWELTKYSYDGSVIYSSPFPWQRTVPGMALDGKPKFGLSKLNQDYFDRLRERVVSAGKCEIYVSIMLFEGHGLHASLEPWCWNGHPFNASNNINGIDGDPDGDGRGIEIHTLQIPDVTRLQEAYVRKVIDTVNDLDNVLYEISNESGGWSTEWQYHLINFIHEYESKKPKRHPVGMTFHYARENRSGTNADLFSSPAEWISPNPQGGYTDNPPESDGSKVILSDTDHLWGIGGNQAWVWKSFCRGLNPLFMDPYSRPKTEEEKKAAWTDRLLTGYDWNRQDMWDPIRRSLGYTLSYSQRMDLASAIPHSDLASTGYCLANPGVEYLVYLPDGGKSEVDLSASSKTFAIEWFNPSTGAKTDIESVIGGGKLFFEAPFGGDAILYISSR